MMRDHSGWYQPAILQAAATCARCLGRDQARAVATAIARAITPHAHRPLALAEENLRILTGHDHAPLRQLARRNLANFLRMMADYTWAEEALPGELAAITAPPMGAAHLQSAIAAANRQPTLLVTGHLGNWELGALHLAAKLPHLTIVTLEEPTPALTHSRAAYRRKFGVETVVIGQNQFAFIDIVKTLEKGHPVAMLVDRPVPGAAHRVPFCGRTTLFSTAPAILWRLTRAHILPVFFIEDANARYRPIALPPPPFTNSPSPAEAIDRNTATLAACFEPVFRKYPCQWYQYAPVFDPHWTGATSRVHGNP